MNARKLTWDDVNVHTSGWVNRKGELRVFASLKNCSFVNHLAWIKNFNPANPATRASLLLVLHKKLGSTLDRLQPFIHSEVDSQ